MSSQNTFRKPRTNVINTGRRSPFKNLPELNDLYSCPVLNIKLKSGDDPDNGEPPKNNYERSTDRVGAEPQRLLTGTSLMMIELLKNSKKEQLYHSSKKEYFDYMAPYRSQACIITSK